MDDTGGSSLPVDSDLPEGTWTVARLNEEVDSVLTDASHRFPTYVVGEVSDVNPYPFGVFFDLRDVTEDAVVSAVAWSHAVDSFDDELEAGTTAVVRASVDFYVEKGNCQIDVSDYWPVGASERQQAYEELKGELTEAGLLADERKRPLPRYPDCVGVVTSLSGSAREDIVTTIRDRAPGVDVKLHDATVQGEQAVQSVVTAVLRLENDPAVDTIVVTRGGGADTDLWCFNEEPVVRAVADCVTPTVAAIGHEDDETLVELVADRRAMTPTEAGVRASPSIRHVTERVAELEHRVDGAYRTLVESRSLALDRRLDRAYASVKRAVEQRRAERSARRQRAASLERRIQAAYTGLATERVNGLETRIDRATEALFGRRQSQRERANHLEARISTAYEGFVGRELSRLEGRLDQGVAGIEHATRAETAAVRQRTADLEARIDRAYTARVDRELDRLERRVRDGYRGVETEQRVAAGTAEARRLRVVVGLLLAALLLGIAVVALFVL